MSDIVLTKEAAVSVRDALAALIESEKQAQARVEAAVKATKQAEDKSAEAVKTAATKLADDMLSQGLITKAGYDRTVENLSHPVTAMAYVKKALSMAKEAKAEKVAEEKEPTRIGRGVTATKYATDKTSKERLEEANRKFEQAIGL